jgi:hypothetical protein
MAVAVPLVGYSARLDGPSTAALAGGSGTPRGRSDQHGARAALPRDHDTRLKVTRTR